MKIHPIVFIAIILFFSWLSLNIGYTFAAKQLTIQHVNVMNVIARTLEHNPKSARSIVDVRIAGYCGKFETASIFWRLLPVGLSEDHALNKSYIYFLASETSQEYLNELVESYDEIFSEPRTLDDHMYRLRNMPPLEHLLLTNNFDYDVVYRTFQDKMKAIDINSLEDDSKKEFLYLKEQFNSNNGVDSTSGS
ncbi:MAG: hypothetical protein AAF571_10650 [Verrucomicrobiota bacterium]